jgi:hypothetical protein
VQNFPNDSTCRLLFARMPWRQWSKGVTVHLALSEAGTCASLYVLYKDIILENIILISPRIEFILAGIMDEQTIVECLYMPIFLAKHPQV